MLCGTGIVTTDQPIVDELFALKVDSALRLRRTVQIIDKVEVYTNHENAGCSLEDVKHSMGDELRWTKIDAKNDPGFDTEVHLAGNARIGQY